MTRVGLDGAFQLSQHIYNFGFIIDYFLGRKSKYLNPNILDGTQWRIDIEIGTREDWVCAPLEVVMNRRRYER